MALTFALTGLILVPSASAGQTPCVGTYAVTIDKTLLNPNGGWSPSEATISLSTPIPAGAYTVTLVSFDDHVAKPTQFDQTHEQWMLELWDSSGGVVLSAGPTPDLPSDESWVTLVTTGTVTGEAVTLHVEHAAIGNNINSVEANCAIFEPIPSGSVGDMVWFDTNGDGVQDAGEDGIEGVVVTLTGPGPDATATTDADGMYLFTGLPAGSYTVTVGAGPAGTQLSTAGTMAVDLAEGEDFVDADFGFTPIPDPVGSIGDKVWLDADGDGTLDSGEFGIEDVEVGIAGPNGSATTMTDGAGMYLFTGLPAGSYTVTVGAGPAGTQLSTVGSFDVDLAPGQDFLDADFGFTSVSGPDPLGSIGDMVWLDLDGDGILDSAETGIVNVTVTLSGPGGDSTAITDGSGMYLFTDLAAGSYTVTVGSGPADTVLSTAGSFQIDLAQGESNLTADFGFTPALPLASLGDIVWFDANENGVVDAGEAGIAGVTVVLTGGSLASPETATTDAAGNYLFVDLPAGTYTVSVLPTDQPINSRPTTPVEFTVTLAGGDVRLDADFGFILGQVAASGIIGDLTWLDSDLDGVRDGGETAIAGVRVNLFNPATGETISAVSSSSGQYLFSALAAGTYEVSVVTSSAGDNLGLTTIGTYVIDLGEGESVLFADFGFAPQLPFTGLETADFGIAGIVLLLIGALAMVLVRPRKASWHLVDAYEVR
jgi:uncharacterized protein (DUF2141 family)